MVKRVIKIIKKIKMKIKDEKNSAPEFKEL